MEITNYILENALILIPALIILGSIIKNTESINDKYIPLILLVLGVIGACFVLGFNIQGIIQGVLVTGAAVYCNQVYKQINK